ncbi:MAG: ferredoxin--NADP reductase [Casimicrobiaceae bacterium]
MSDGTSWGEYRYRLVSSAAVTPAIRELWLAPCGDALPYQPGQYVLLNDTAYQLPQRSYSLANAPRTDHWASLLVTRFPGGPTSGWVHDVLHSGDEVTLAGPYGTFVLDDHRNGPILLLAAGSGLAPIRALAEALRAHEPERTFTLFFSARTAADTIDGTRFSDWARTYAGFRYLLTLTRDPAAPRHRRIPDLLADTLGSLRGWEVFTAGPSGFVTGCVAAVRALGVDPGAVHTEEFFADPQPWTGDPPRSADEGV